MFVGVTADIVPNEKSIVDNSRHVECLAKNIYHEARGEPANGKQAVAHVVLNRVNRNDFPNTICAVGYSSILSSANQKCAS